MTGLTYIGYLLFIKSKRKEFRKGNIEERNSVNLYCTISLKIQIDTVNILVTAFLLELLR